MRSQLVQIAFVGALGLVAACSPENRPEAADRPPAADAKPDVGARASAATETARTIWKAKDATERAAGPEVARSIASARRSRSAVAV